MAVALGGSSDWQHRHSSVLLFRSIAVTSSSSSSSSGGGGSGSGGGSRAVDELEALCCCDADRYHVHQQSSSHLTQHSRNCFVCVTPVIVIFISGGSSKSHALPAGLCELMQLRHAVIVLPPTSAAAAAATTRRCAVSWSSSGSCVTCVWSADVSCPCYVDNGILVIFALQALLLRLLQRLLRFSTVVAASLFLMKRMRGFRRLMAVFEALR
jgi:hypothetical protein